MPGRVSGSVCLTAHSTLIEDAIGTGLLQLIEIVEVSGADIALATAEHRRISLSGESWIEPSRSSARCGEHDLGKKGLSVVAEGVEGRFQ